ncbi:MAG: thioredoxin family protein [Kiritimatiellia bacterium]
MKKSMAFIGLVAILATACTERVMEARAETAAGDALWMTDYPAAAAKAKAENKALLLDFTGSDWCGWCIKLDKEVFSKKAFQDYATGKFVLVKLDFPRRKKLPAAEQAQNEKLLQKYSVEGFPTIIILDSQEKQVGATGYQAGGPEAYIKHLESLLKKGAN